MKVVVGGKGGAGKTTVAAVLARILAQRGTTVIALDGDPNPNLGIALGLGCNQTAGLDSVVNAVFKERAGGGHSDRAGRPVPDRHADELLEELGVTAPDGVRLVQCGRIERPADGCLCCGSHITTRRMFAEFSGQGRVVIADLEPGVNDLIWINPGSQDAVVIVTQPSRKSLEVTRRALQIADDFSVGLTVVVANRVAGGADMEEIRRFLPGVEVVEVPEDDAVSKADAVGESVMDLAPGCPAVQAISALASRLVDPATG